MIQHKAYKFRIYPSEQQVKKLENTFGCVRFVWNNLVASFKNKEKQKSIKELRKEFEFLKNVSAGALQQKEIDFKCATKQFFSKLKKKKLARLNFKSRKKSANSFKLSSQKYYFIDSKISLEKIGKVKCVIDREIPNNVKFFSCVVSKNKIGQYYVSVLVEEYIERKVKTNKSVGIDLGIKEFITTSDGVQKKMFDFNENQVRIKHLQKHLARKKVGSTRFNKLKMKIAKLHLKISRKREWLLHQMSNELINNYDVICIENLNIQGMMNNHKLAGAIQKQSWSKFNTILEYKAKWYGREIIKINRFFPSSKLCSSCGCIKEDLKLSDRIYTCDCGLVIDRDYNAAINILAAGVTTA